MPSVYTTVDACHDFMGEDLVTTLSDLDEDGGDDTAIVTARIAEAGAEIDSFVGVRYTVPLANITDVPATPAIIQLVAKRLVAAYLIQPKHGIPETRKQYLEAAMSVLKEIANGTRVVPGATPLPADEQGLVGFAVQSGDGTEPTFASVDADGDDNMKSW